jgi:hypothetical protein
MYSVYNTIAKQPIQPSLKYNSNRAGLGWGLTCTHAGMLYRMNRLRRNRRAVGLFMLLCYTWNLGFDMEYMYCGLCRMGL